MHLVKVYAMYECARDELIDFFLLKNASAVLYSKCAVKISYKPNKAQTIKRDLGTVYR